MNQNDPISNPTLIAAMQIVKHEFSETNMEFFMEELVKASFICPVTVDPVPEVREDGSFDMPKGAKISFPMVTNKEGKKLFMAYTDMIELMRWRSDRKQAVLVFSLADYARMLLEENNPVSGIVINPFGEDNMPVPKELVAIINEKLLKSQAEEKKETNEK